MGDKRLFRDVLFVLTMVLLSAVFLKHYLSIYGLFPYYFMYDHDLTSTIDVMYLNSGKIPGSFAHPASGMYLFQFIYQKLAHLTGAVSVLTLQDLDGTLQPFWAVAELTASLRVLQPYLYLVFALFCWATIAIAFRLPRWLSVLVLPLFATQVSHVFVSASVRSEFYSVFYWAASLLLLSLASRSSRLRVLLPLLFAGGVFLGLSFMTKTQSIFYIAFVPFFFLYLQTISPFEEKSLPVSRKTGLISVCHAGGNLVFFLLLAWAAYRAQLPPAIATFAKFENGLTVNVLIFFAAFLIPVGLLAFLFWRKGTDCFVFRTFALLGFVGSGFLLAYLLHFLMHGDWYEGYRHMVYTLKVQLWSKSTLAEAQNVTSFSGLLNVPFFGRIKGAFGREPAIMILHFCALATFVTATLTRLAKVGRLRLGIAGMILLVTLLSIVFGNRLMNKDDIYLEPIVNLGSLLYLGMTMYCLEKRRIILQIATGVALLVVSVSQASAASRALETQLADNWIMNWGYHQERWFSGIFQHQSAYTDIMAQRVGNKLKEHSFRAADFDQVRAVAKIVFPNSALDFTNLGSAFVGMPVWHKDLDWRIAQVPDQLRGGIVMDFLDGTDTDVDPIPVNARRDYNVLLFIDVSKLPQLLNEGRPPESMSLLAEPLILQKGDQQRPMAGLILKTNVHRIPRSLLQGDAFAVLREK